jgi:hypothetical protein
VEELQASAVLVLETLRRLQLGIGGIEKHKTHLLEDLEGLLTVDLLEVALVGAEDLKHQIIEERRE